MTVIRAAVGARKTACATTSSVAVLFAGEHRIRRRPSPT